MPSLQQSPIIQPDRPKLYQELAEWWPLLSTPVDYAEEAAFFRQTLLAACKKPPRTLLELGSGGGNNASHLKGLFQMTLVDLSTEMLTVSCALNPECEHIAGDMRTVRLGYRFDAVFIHDAIMYMTSEHDLRRAIETAYVHCDDGGAALFAPDCVLETFTPSTKHGGHDGKTRSLRYLEWTYDPEPRDNSFVVDFAYLLRENETVRVEHDRHVFGLFARADWLRLMSEVGFQTSVVIDSYSRELFVGRKSKR